MTPIEDGISRALNSLLKSAPEICDGSLEVEAKFGILIDKQTNSRIQLPVTTECIINAEYPLRFESDVGMEMHKHLNKILNKSTQSGAYRYVHTKTLDRFVQSHSGQKARVTSDPSSAEIIEVIEKRRLMDVSVHFPNSPFDVRISINHEVVAKDLDLTHLNAPESRYKDRLKYTGLSGVYCIDLTQVTNERGKKLHEIEVEILRHGPESIGELVDTIRHLSWEICHVMSGK